MPLRAALLILVALAQTAVAGPFRERLLERQAQESVIDDDEPAASARLPAGIRILRDIPYGDDPRQRFDTYLPSASVTGAPVILMVHGGGWRIGDKAHGNVVENKVARWVPRGAIFLSVNYRMVPQADPLEQARDVARALAAAQRKAAGWGGDNTKFILMGHSAGAHLVGLLAASPDLARQQGAAPWLGTVMLDSGAIDVPQIMNARHLRLYDQAFGGDPAFWRAVSPYHALSKAGAPVLAVCSSRRLDSCPQSRRFAAKADSLGAQVTVLPEDLSHGEINSRLGEPSAYTATVESFLGGLDPSIARALSDNR